MRLKGTPPGGVPAISYVGSPTGKVIGSDEPLVSKVRSGPDSMVPGPILSAPGKPGPRGEEGIQGPPGDGLELDGQVPEYSDLPSSSLEGEVWLAAGKLYRRHASGWPAEADGSPFQGPEGPKGDQGDQGIQGLKGDKGDTGDQGIQGIQGLKGDKGDQGDQGIQGIQGLKGDKGDQGDQGIQGIQGVKGDKGDKGDTGAPGTTDFNALSNKPSTYPPTIGSTASTAVAGNDTRLTDTRTPTDNTVSTAKIQDSAVTSAKIADGTIVNADINASAAIALSKLAAGYVAGSVNGTATTTTVWRGTLTQYNAISTKDSNTIYLWSS